MNMKSYMLILSNLHFLNFFPTICEHQFIAKLCLLTVGYHKRTFPKIPKSPKHKMVLTKLLYMEYYLEFLYDYMYTSINVTKHSIFGYSNILCQNKDLRVLLVWNSSCISWNSCVYKH